MPKSRNKRKSAKQNARIKREKLQDKSKQFNKNRRLPSSEKYYD